MYLDQVVQETTLVKRLLKNSDMQNFYSTFMSSYKIKEDNKFKTSVSLMPMPNYRKLFLNF